MEEQEKYSISTFSLIEHPLKEALTQLIDTGWRSIELMCEDGHRELMKWTTKELEQLKDFGLRNRVKWTLHAPIRGLNPCAESDFLIDESKQNLLRAAHIAAYLNCNYVVVHCGQLVPPLSRAERDLPSEERAALQRCITFMKDILQHTEGDNVTFALENVPPYPDLLGTEVDFIIDVVESVDSPRLRIVFDVAHAHLLGEGKCMSSLERVIPHTIGLHINDNLGDYDNHLAVGDGNIPFRDIVTFLKNSDFRGNWTMETCQTDYAEKSVIKLRQIQSLK